MEENQLFTKIRQWGYDRNIINGATPKDQLIKLMEECGELAKNMARDKEVADDIGDIVVVLTLLAAQYGLPIEHCISLAFNEIKDRKGRLVNGIYVKEGDL